jgi:hypothetical protein
MPPGMRAVAGPGADGVGPKAGILTNWDEVSSGEMNWKSVFIKIMCLLFERSETVSVLSSSPTWLRANTARPIF